MKSDVLSVYIRVLSTTLKLNETNCLQYNKIKMLHNFLKDFKGSDGNVLWTKFFRIYLRHIKRFYDVYLLSLSAKSTFKIMN